MMVIDSCSVVGVHIRCCGNGVLWFRSYSGSLLANARNAGPAKSKQKVFAPPVGASLRLGMPERRPVPGPSRLLAAIGVNGARRSKSKARSKTTPLLCRSRLASEKPENAALNQAANVIVNDLREQARSYKPLKPAGRPLCFAFDLDLRHTEPKRGAEWWGKS